MKFTIRSSIPRYNYHYQYKPAQTPGKLFAVEINTLIKLIRSWSLLLAGIVISTDTDQQTPGLGKFLSEDMTGIAVIYGWIKAILFGCKSKPMVQMDCTDAF